MMRQMSITKIYDHLYQVLRSESFLNKKGLGNEVPFFICPHDPSKAVEMDQIRLQLVSQLNGEGIDILDINLYDLAIQILDDRKIWNKILEIEITKDKSVLLELLRNVLDPETHLIPAIADLISNKPDYRVMFLSGVGEIFPYIRSHTVLNNLQSTAKDQPTVLFFPGTYTQSMETGASLDLFSRLHDDKYYRAFNILNYQA
ncbi:MAG: DUF1788 domain-containing protein [Aggregatilineales bacterium]